MRSIKEWIWWDTVRKARTLENLFLELRRFYARMAVSGNPGPDRPGELDIVRMRLHRLAQSYLRRSYEREISSDKAAMLYSEHWLCKAWAGDLHPIRPLPMMQTEYLRQEARDEWKIALAIASGRYAHEEHMRIDLFSRIGVMQRSLVLAGLNHASISIRPNAVQMLYQKIGFRRESFQSA